MENDSKKKKKIIVIALAILIALTIILYFINKNIKDKKVLRNYDYIIEKEVKNNNDNGNLPSINLKGKEIDKINQEIFNKYYSTLYNEGDIFEYEYYVYKDILSIFMTVVYEDNSEYGEIEYYTYNINTKNNKTLSNEELLEYLKINKKDIDDKINERLKEYYTQDSLNTEMSLSDYKKNINYQEKNNKLVIKEDGLYCYQVFQVTQSLIEYKGNVNEIKITNLSK